MDTHKHPVEIEKKFLVKTESLPNLGDGVLFKQGYLCTEKGRTVRVRLAGDQGFLTVKGRSQGPERPEFEYEIPREHASFMINNLCQKPIIEKKRYKIQFENHTWEIDEFFGENLGLWLAEIELESVDEHFEVPPWAGMEVTEDSRYANASLVSKPFSAWGNLKDNS